MASQPAQASSKVGKAKVRSECTGSPDLYLTYQMAPVLSECREVTFGWRELSVLWKRQSELEQWVAIGSWSMRWRN